MTSKTVTEYLKQVLKLTLAKRHETDELYKEDYQLDQVPPAPGKPGRQHETMVQQGLCQEACKYPYRNRYCNLFPFDTNLVSLGRENSYINASWLRLQDPEIQYIAAMGPMTLSSYSVKLKPDSGGVEDTCGDFWEMCWNTKSKIVVMLCTIQVGFTGCSPYYPQDGETEISFRPFTIRILDVKDEEHFTQRNIRIIKDGEETARDLVHLQFKSWPNYGVPDGPGPISQFLRHTYDLAQAQKPLESQQPELVVHCSGGIGRTGTFIAAYQTFSHLVNLSKQAQVPDRKPEAISIFDLVWSLRRQRHPWMVEGTHQYEMAYDIIIQLLKELVGSK